MMTYMVYLASVTISVHATENREEGSLQPPDRFLNNSGTHRLHFCTLFTKLWSSDGIKPHPVWPKKPPFHLQAILFCLFLITHVCHSQAQDLIHASRVFLG